MTGLGSFCQQADIYYGNFLHYCKYQYEAFQGRKCVFFTIWIYVIFGYFHKYHLHKHIIILLSQSMIG